MIKTKRVYEAASKDDGYRVLVDRLWPRGVSKQKAKVDLWLKEVAPSNELRVWYDHQDEKFDEFKKLYALELDKNPATQQLRDLIKERKIITLIYSAKNPLNQVAALQDYLKD